MRPIAGPKAVSRPPEGSRRAFLAAVCGCTGRCREGAAPPVLPRQLLLLGEPGFKEVPLFTLD